MEGREPREQVVENGVKRGQIHSDRPEFPTKGV